MCGPINIQKNNVTSITKNVILVPEMDNFTSFFGLV